MNLSNHKTLENKELAIKKTVQERDSRTSDQEVLTCHLNCRGHGQEICDYTVSGEDEAGCDYEHPIELSRHAETQLLNRLNIPAGYYHRCSGELRSSNFQYWKNHDQFKNKPLLLRWIDDHIRAVFSTRYSSGLDDAILVPVALSALREACTDTPEDILHLKDFNQDEDFTLLRALYKNERTEYEGTLYFAGVTIVNSEVGKSSIWIRPTIRSGNYNGAYDFIDRSREGCMSIRHIGNLEVEKVREAIIEAKRVASVGIYRLMETATERINNPVSIVSKLVESSNFLTQRIVQIVEEEYRDDQEVTRLKLAQTMLEAIKELPLFQKYLAEQDIGRFLDLFRDTDNRLESIEEDLVWLRTEHD